MRAHPAHPSHLRIHHFPVFCVRALPIDGFIVSHLPHGPTASFSLSNVVLRHDIENRVRGQMNAGRSGFVVALPCPTLTCACLALPFRFLQGSVSEAYPHLIFHNFKTRLVCAKASCYPLPPCDSA
jgi:hypothetical protein